jgi:hypothetical protein
MWVRAGQSNARVKLPVAVHSTGEVDRCAVAVLTGNDLQYRQGISGVCLACLTDVTCA